MQKKTSWGAVADWYDDVLGDPDSYQKKVLMPNLIRIVEPKAGMTILDNACGQGYFARAFAENGAKVIACDISEELIEIAQKNSVNSVNSASTANPEYHAAPANKLSFMTDKSTDLVVIVLALQNIDNLAETLVECARVLKPGGRLVMVLNHPAFRIPQSSSWQWEETDGQAKQFRRIDSYMSDKQLKIDMSPGEANIYKKKFTVSLHRPLQSYFKALNKSGLAVTRLEEWISHKKSQAGPRATEEDRMRKEIPMFLCLEAVKQ